ncbi:MAG: hypothetical protein QOF79_892 [Actinomycetota bacterium]|jgi:uncharacterized membrane protein YsdA (DUF1294 family)/cold shock CspA family protein|nr:hypothetical protein [Actinomycetota bacterium]
MSSSRERLTGGLTFWNDARGFGFITPPGGEQVFVHIEAFPFSSRRPLLGDDLEFELELAPDGRRRAKRAQIVGSGPADGIRRARYPVRPGIVSFVAIPAFLAVYVLVSLASPVPYWVAILYLGASVLCFVAYAVDKSAAVAGRWRISESILLSLGLIGGWPGAIVAQQILRHKTKKTRFRSAFWGSVLLNVVAFVALASPVLPTLVHFFGD